MKPFRPPPATVTRAIIIVCVVVAVASFLGGAVFAERLVLQAGLIPARLTGQVAGIPGSLPAAATLVSSQFLHGGFVHAALNLVFLAWIGRHVEWITGRARFLLLYLGGGVAGGLLETLVNPSGLAPVIGASGAIAAIFGAYAVMFARSRATGRRILGIEVSADAATALWYAAVWISLQLLTALALGGSGGPQVAIWAHIGGFVTGLLYAMPFGRGPKI